MLIALFSFGSISFSNAAPTGAGTGQLITDLQDLLGKGLSLLRVAVFNFLLFYGLYLGVTIGFGQGDPRQIANFIIGSIFAAAAQAIGFFASIFTG
jgi:hypothetical protein